jgi:putative hydrolase
MSEPKEGLAVRFDEDYHVHSTFSDGASTLAQNVDAARRRGLRRLCLSDHVRADTAWLPEYAEAVGALRGGDLEVLTGVEVKILDADGELDLPAGRPDLDLVLVADHQYPGEHGPEHPGVIREQLGDGTLAAAEVIGGLVQATGRALGRVPAPARPLLAHLFSLLPKMGLAEEAVPEGSLRWLAGQARSAGAMVEINEKWACPGPRALAAFAQAGVPVVAGSDSHHSRDVGVFRAVRQAAARTAA